MVKKPDIQYIDRFYVHGSEARILELKPRGRIIRTVLPLSAPDKTVKIAIDPLAVSGIVVAVALLVMLVLGSLQYMNVCRQYRAMMDYVVTVQNENVELQESYRSQIDLAEIEEKALAMGMIPASEGKKIVIHPVMPQEEPKMTLWEEIVWFCEGLFA